MNLRKDHYRASQTVKGRGCARPARGPLPRRRRRPPTHPPKASVDSPCARWDPGGGVPRAGSAGRPPPRSRSVSPTSQAAGRARGCGAWRPAEGGLLHHPCRSAAGPPPCARLPHLPRACTRAASAPVHRGAARPCAVLPRFLSSLLPPSPLSPGRWHRPPRRFGARGARAGTWPGRGPAAGGPRKGSVGGDRLRTGSSRRGGARPG